MAEQKSPVTPVKGAEFHTHAEALAVAIEYALVTYKVPQRVYKSRTTGLWTRCAKEVF